MELCNIDLGARRKNKISFNARHRDLQYSFESQKAESRRSRRESKSEKVDISDWEGFMI